MRFLFLLFTLTFFSCSTASNTKVSSSIMNAGDERSSNNYIPGLQIVYSANVSGEIEPCGCRRDPSGGIHRRWNVLETYRPQNENQERLSLESGDLFFQTQPVPTFLEKPWIYQAEVLVEALNSMKLDVFAPGELDFGAGLDIFLKLKQKAKFQIVNANIYKKGTNKRLLEPYVILRKAGKKIAVVGLFDENLPLPTELEAKNHLMVASELIPILREKADFVVALTHLGFTKDKELAERVPGIDLIFGSHSLSFLDPPVKVAHSEGVTTIFQTSLRGQHLGITENNEHQMIQLSPNFDSKPGDENPMDQLLKKSRKKLKQIQKDQELELFSGVSKQKQKKKARFLEFTFPNIKHFQNARSAISTSISST